MQKKTWKFIANYLRSKQINYKFEINSIISDNEIMTDQNDIASKCNDQFT